MANQQALSEFQALIDQINAISSNASPRAQIGKGLSLTTKGKVDPYKDTVDLSDLDFSVGGKNKNVDMGINVFDMLAGIFAPIDNPIKNQIAYWTDGKLDSHDMPLSTKNFGTNPIASLFTKGAFGGISGALDKIGVDKDNVVQKYLKSMSFNNKTNGSLDQLVSDALKVQGDKWNDGKFSWGDVPAVGFLHGLDTKSKTGEDILKNLGTKSGLGRTLGGIGLDLALSPSMYFTGGLAAAGKVGNASKLAKMAEIAKAEGLTGKFNDVNQLRQAIASAHKGTQASLTHKLGKYVDEINEAYTVGHNSAINTLGLSIPNPVPFTKPFNGYKKIMDLKADNLLFRGAPKIGEVGANSVNKMLKDVNLNTDEILKRVYNVDKAEDLTSAQLDDLAEKLESFKSLAKQLPNKEVNQVVKMIKNTPEMFRKDEMQQILNTWKYKGKPLDQLKEILEQVAKNPSKNNIRGGNLGLMMRDYWHAQPTKNFSRAANNKKADAFLDTAHKLADADKRPVVKTTAKNVKTNAKGHSRFVDDIFKPTEILNTESTNMAKSIAKKNPFDLRTFKSKSDFINGLANHLADAQNEKIGGMAQYRKKLQGLEKMASDLNPDEKKAAIHILENAFPKNFKWDGIDKAKAQEYAKEMGKLFKELAKSERDTGVLGATMKHYFPHIKNLSDAEIESMMQKLGKFNGKSQSNKFNQKREGFRTLADRDNFVDDAEKQLANNTNLTTEERSELEDMIEKAKGMFNEDTNEVILKRVGASLQSQAMKKMYNQFKKNGALVTKTKGSTQSTKGLKRVPDEVASKLGLGKGNHYMHPDVMKGLERVDELFTDEGMNRFMRTLGGVSSIFRTVTTTFLPSHYINNYVGNLFINEAAGVSVKEYNRSIRLLKKYHSGKKLNEAEQKIIDAAFKNNVINGGYNLDTDTFKTVTRGKDVGKTLTKIADKLEGFNEKILNTKVGKTMKHGGEFIDDTARLANFLNGLDKHNGNVKLATGQVRKYLFNYAENTNADRHMRAIVPFWNWIKRNVPLQINQVIENPKYFQTIEAIKDMFNEGREGEDWQKEGGIKIPFEDKYLRLPFPTSDLSMLENPVRGLLSSTQPLIKSPIELSTNKNLFTGNPITFGENQTSIPDALDYLFRSTTGIGSKAVSPFYDERNEDLSVAEKLQKMIASLFISTSDVNK